jgi:hypothetical protein
MYGDDTWLKLFPKIFAHADRMGSFLVSVSHKRPNVAYSRSV